MKPKNTRDNSNLLTFADIKEPKRDFFLYREPRLQIPSDITSTVEIEFEDSTIVLKLLDITNFGFRAEIFSPETSLTINQKPIRAKVAVSTYEIFNGFVKVMNENVNSDKISFGFSVSEGKIDKDLVHSIVEGNEFKPRISKTNELIESFNFVKPEFKVAVSDLCATLKFIESKFSYEEDRLNQSNKKNTLKQKETMIDLAMSIYSPVLGNMFLEFEKIISDFSDDEHHIHKKYFRSIFSELVKATPFFNRAFQKPLGYAGDYGLMVMFYEYADIGESLFHKFMHRWACNQPVSLANRNRVEFLSNILTQEFSNHSGASFKISSIACGPAQEISLFLKDLETEKDVNISINLLDQEGKALEFAQSNVRKYAKNEFNLVTKAFKEDIVLGSIKQRPFTAEVAGSNIIVSAGLFDYLSDRVAKKLIDSLFDLLGPGGILLIGNVSTYNPDRFAMDYLLDWNLILRSKDNLLNLISDNVKNKSNQIEVLSEALDLNLFLKITR